MTWPVPAWHTRSSDSFTITTTKRWKGLHGFRKSFIAVQHGHYAQSQHGQRLHTHKQLTLTNMSKCHLVDKLMAKNGSYISFSEVWIDSGNALLKVLVGNALTPPMQWCTSQNCDKGHCLVVNTVIKVVITLHQQVADICGFNLRQHLYWDFGT